MDGTKGRYQLVTARLVTSVQVRALAEQVRAVNPEWRAMIVRARPVWT